MRRRGVLVSVACSALLAGVVACAGAVHATDTDERTHRVLFIGNSLTYYNDLPGTLAAIAFTGGETIVVASVTRGGFALMDHVMGTRRTDAVERIRGARWEYVVLQQGPTSRATDRDTLLLAARRLDEPIRAAGARVALYMVWPALADSASFGPVRVAYRETACRVKGDFWPAGEAWRTAWRADPTLRFYGADDFHPSPLGTYLVALVMYERITGRDARTLPARATVDGAPSAMSPATIRLLQEAAHATNEAFPTACHS
ncbi:MAG: hypothetical protein JWL95_2386 [Gemmatimonadetes bacterium]|nr:hypothetical protein [Gemmatimonadota bacterium]